jgi:hypothetical protein
MEGSNEGQSGRDSIYQYGTSVSSFPETDGETVSIPSRLERSGYMRDPHPPSGLILGTNTLPTNLPFHNDARFDSPATSLLGIPVMGYDGFPTSIDSYAFYDRPFYDSGELEFQRSWDEHQV